jgi:aryl-alcohol dehydrogenase-like predicted oxidoreductase
MEYRQLGGSGLRGSALTLGTMTFGGRGQFRDVPRVDSRDSARADMTLLAIRFVAKGSRTGGAGGRLQRRHCARSRERAARR